MTEDKRAKLDPSVLQEWQAIRWGDKPSTLAALAYLREHNWKVDEPNTRLAVEDAILWFKAGYEDAAQQHSEPLDARDCLADHYYYLGAKAGWNRAIDNTKIQYASLSEIGAKLITTTTFDAEFGNRKPAFDQVRKALSSEPERGWMPIESAPKEDGKEILGLRLHEYDGRVWPIVHTYQYKLYDDPIPGDEGVWLKYKNIGGRGPHGYVNTDPDYWMPLPNPPISKDDDE